jgi:exodeoxyribonuclease VII small subunit
MTNNNFEESFKRLEQIVDKINEGTISLDDTLKLYEEADALITSCQKKLSQAEEKIEILIKSRDNKICLNEENRPLMEPFAISAPSY